MPPRPPAIAPPRAVSAGLNRWDLALLPLVLAGLTLLAWGASQLARPWHLGEALPLSLDPAGLPALLARTLLRMAAGMALSLLFAVGFALAAAKSRAAERVLVPLLDILQSIPILGFLSITVTGFLALFPGRLAGMECAAIFAIFTSQAWNLAFSLYQSLRTVPGELDEAARLYRLSGWQRFWQLELPFAMPGLLWNAMMSMSGGWFFVVASEAISVSGQSVRLPGVGSYIALAIEQRDLHAIGWAIAAMAAGIVLVDQLVFRPLVAWGQKFRFDEGGGGGGERLARSWLHEGLRRSRAAGWLATQALRAGAVLTRWLARRDDAAPRPLPGRPAGLAAWLSPARRRWLGDGLLLLAVLAALARLVAFVHTEVGWAEAAQVLLLGAATLARVLVLIALALLLWVPVGVWIGLRPRWAARLQALAQVLAAFPANLVFPLAVVAIVRGGLDPDLWLSPLMVLGTQWYILFNVIAGASAIPLELRLAADNLGLRGWLRWRRYLLPAVFPAAVTGAITASGGSWNASIVAEWVRWGDTTLQAHGLGAYIARMTEAGDFPRIALGIGVMCLYVMLLNHTLWRRLYRLAESRARL